MYRAEKWLRILLLNEISLQWSDTAGGPAPQYSFYSIRVPVRIALTEPSFFSSSQGRFPFHSSFEVDSALFSSYSSLFCVKWGTLSFFIPRTDDGYYKYFFWKSVIIFNTTALIFTFFYCFNWSIVDLQCCVNILLFPSV